jgi:hypothetical protein
MPTPRGFLGAATAKGFAFAIAGRVAGELPVERYDPNSDTWKRLEPMPGPLRNRFGIAVLDERIYVVGGEQQEDASVPLSVWRYQPEACAKADPERDAGQFRIGVWPALTK